MYRAVTGAMLLFALMPCRLPSDKAYIARDRFQVVSERRLSAECFLTMVCSLKNEILGLITSEDGTSFVEIRRRRATRLGERLDWILLD